MGASYYSRDSLEFAASYSFHVFVEASILKLHDASKLSLSNLDRILISTSSCILQRRTLNNPYAAFGLSVEEHGICRNGALLDWLLAYGARPNERAGSPGTGHGLSFSMMDVV